MYTDDTYAVRTLVMRRVNDEFKPEYRIVTKEIEAATNLWIKKYSSKYQNNEIYGASVGTDPSHPNDVIVSFLNKDGEAMEWDC